MNNKDDIYADLQELDLSDAEIQVYLSLLEKPNTHLQIARLTGINRTKVYRVVELLEKRSLVSRRTDDRGTFLVAHDPDALEIDLVAQEERLKHRRQALRKLAPKLQSFRRETTNPFAIHTYEGVEGLKQMAWHELKADGELLTFGNSTFEQIVGDHRWSEKLRARAVVRGYKTREIFNDPNEKPDFTEREDYLKLYEARRISEDALPVATPMVIYNDTVAIYQFEDGKRVGVEIVNANFARTMRSIFEQYWKLGKKLE